MVFFNGFPRKRYISIMSRFIVENGAKMEARMHKIWINIRF
jgi:hypothetical protein